MLKMVINYALFVGSSGCPLLSVKLCSLVTSPLPTLVIRIQPIKSKSKNWIRHIINRKCTLQIIDKNTHIFCHSVKVPLQSLSFAFNPPMKCTWWTKTNISVRDGEQHATYCNMINTVCLTHRGSRTPVKSQHKLTETRIHSVHARLGPNLRPKLHVIFYPFFKEKERHSHKYEK